MKISTSISKMAVRVVAAAADDEEDVEVDSMGRSNIYIRIHTCTILYFHGSHRCRYSFSDSSNFFASFSTRNIGHYNLFNAGTGPDNGTDHNGL